MELRCGNCSARVPSANVSVVEDTAVCALCEQVNRLSLIGFGPFAPPAALSRPPPGCWVCEIEGGLVLGLSRHEIGTIIMQFIFTIGYAIVVLAAGSACAIAWAAYLTGSPGPSRLLPGFGPPAPMLPLMVLTAIVALLLLNGVQQVVELPRLHLERTEVRIGETDVEVFEGAGEDGRSSSFAISDVVCVKERATAVDLDDESDPGGGWTSRRRVVRRRLCIDLESGRSVCFARHAPRSRRDYLAAALRAVLLSRSP